METLNDMLEDVWNSQEGKVCALVSWERFSSLQQAQVFTRLKKDSSVILTLCLNIAGLCQSIFCTLK